MIRFALSLLLVCVSAAHAREPLRVGLVDSPPFSTQAADGTWTGVAVDLWDMTANAIDVDWTPVAQNTYQQMLDAVADGSLDVAVGGISVTPDRASRVDFLSAWESATTGVAIPAAYGLQFSTLIESLADSAFMGLSLVMISLVLVFGIAIWICERRHNHGEFGGEHYHGLGSGLWWSMVTMSTVGYGDKSPRTWSGRTIAGIWIILALVLVSVFTGAAATAFTQRTVSPTAHLAELRGRSVGSLEGGDTARWLRSKGIAVTTVGSTSEGMKQVADGTLDAFVGDVPVLRWTQLNDAIDGLDIRGGLRPERLAFAARPGFELEREVNVALLRAMQSAEWLGALQAWGWPREGVLR